MRERFYFTTPADAKETLLKYIPASSLPKKYGGELEWNPNDPPNFDEDALTRLGGEPGQAPIYFILDENGSSGKIVKAGDLIQENAARDRGF